MAGFKMHQLQNTFTQVTLHYLNPFTFKKRIQFTLLRQHRLALNKMPDTMLFQDAINDVTILLTILRPMYMSTICLRICLKLH